MSDFRVKEAFLAVRDGRSPEYVICDENLNAQFLATARQLGVQGSDAEINTELINLRKEKKLEDCPTTHRKTPDPNRRRYLNAVSQTVRLLERQFSKNVDDIICDPLTRAQFDAMIQFLSPGASIFETQYAALSLRKSSQLQPEPVGRIIRTVSSQMMSLVDLETRLGELPQGPGVYIFWNEQATMYAGKADNLQKRIGTHISTWSFREIIRQIRDGQMYPTFVVYHELPVTILPRDLTAYETELIRSRTPEHNRAGRIQRGADE
jgi:hypothetical protein